MTGNDSGGNGDCQSQFVHRVSVAFVATQVVRLDISHSIGQDRPNFDAHSYPQSLNNGNPNRVAATI